ncbi:chromosome partitioning protein, partial [Rhodococcus sp. C26F]
MSATRKGGLGRGLAALIPTGPPVDAEQKPTAAPSSTATAPTATAPTKTAAPAAPAPAKSAPAAGAPSKPASGG